MDIFIKIYQKLYINQPIEYILLTHKTLQTEYLIEYLSRNSLEDL
jgi:hypothetical protein